MSRIKNQQGRGEKNETRVICFDMWGTLVEGGGERQMKDLKGILRAQAVDWERFLSQVEESCLTHPWTLEEGIKDLVKNLRLRVNEETIKKGYENWWDYVKRAKPFSETEAVLRKLQERNFRLLVVSNTDLVAFRFKIKELDWEKFFEKFFLSCKIGVLKPHPRIFEAVEKYLGVNKKEILMVDDSLYHGVWPARKFGWQALWVARGKEDSDLGKIDDLRGILAFL